MLTGLTNDTFKHLELDAGVFLKNVDLSEITSKTALASAIETARGGENWVGATVGGGTFECKPTTREVEVDGMRTAFVGSTILDAWDISLKTELAEFTPDNMVLALGAAEVKTSGSVKTVEIKNSYSEDSYIDKFCWVGELTDGTLVAIELDNALATSGLSLKFADKGNATVPIELKAHQSDVAADAAAPARIMYFS